MTDAFVGEIVLYACAFAPRGWIPCTGQILSMNDDRALFSLLGTKFGGNGTTSFAVPDFGSVAPHGLQYCIATQGVFPQREGPSGRLTAVGEISILPYGFTPEPYVGCTGQRLDIAEYSELYAVIGTNFGGDGAGWFGVPNLTQTQPTQPEGDEGSLYFVATEGSNGAFEAFISEVRLFPFQVAPLGWVACAGQLLPIQQYPPLFALIGSKFGGDGKTTFAAPDLRAVTPPGMQYSLAVDGAFPSN
jgi:microcystin-dependent protein